MAAAGPAQLDRLPRARSRPQKTDPAEADRFRRTPSGTPSGCLGRPPTTQAPPHPSTQLRGRQRARARHDPFSIPRPTTAGACRGDLVGGPPRPRRAPPSTGVARPPGAGAGADAALACHTRQQSSPVSQVHDTKERTGMPWKAQRPRQRLKAKSKYSSNQRKRAAKKDWQYREAAEYAKYLRNETAGAATPAHSFRQGVFGSGSLWWLWWLWWLAGGDR
ncbi:hypothetical protein DFJ73DRAFT_899708 [Zopfochytrium polystomum]|nr:hypothetical protein DFJ73DRAFT_899708 [Zopfochytrium polystomum]